MRTRLAVSLITVLALTLAVLGFSGGAASAQESTGFLVEAPCGHNSMVNGCTKGPLSGQATDITPKSGTITPSAHAAPKSLAYTGTETTVAALGGVTLLAAGAMVLNTRRKVEGFAS